MSAPLIMTNPIRTVDGNPVYVPSTYEVSYYDISSSDAGNTEDGTMHKLRIGQKVKINLAYQNISMAKCAELLTAFDPEYISVTYFDPKSNAYVTKQFYVGDRSVPVYNNKLGIVTKLAFNLIAVSPDSI